MTKPKRSSSPKRDSRRQFVLRDRYACTALILVSLAARIPFLKTFDLVSYDGTYYINQAKTLLSGNSASAFPIGYPAFIALLLPIIHDGVRAAQTVSLLAALASLCVFYLLCGRFVRRELAMVGALRAWRDKPIFIQYSLMTMSESSLSLLGPSGPASFHPRAFRAERAVFGNGRDHPARSHRDRRRPQPVQTAPPRRVLRLLGGFALVYVLGSAALSVSVGQVAAA